MPSTNWNSIVSDLPAGPRVRIFARVCLAAAAVLVCCSLAHAQGGVPLVTVATDQSPLQLSNQFGVPAGTAINQAGDFAFVGNGDTAIFLRPAGAASATRLLQIEDEAPGFPGSQIAAFSPYVSLNASRVLLLGIVFRTSANLEQAALLIYDGANYKTIVKTGDAAPGPGGGTFTTSLNPGSIDDSGDIDFAAVPSGGTAQTYYIVPAGGAPLSIVAANDTPPAVCTWCTSGTSVITFFPGQPAGSAIFLGVGAAPQLNAQGQMLLSLWGGLFIGAKDGSLSLVPMAASGPCSPQPVSSGTGTPISNLLSGYLNNVGVVAYSNPSSGAFTAICVAPAGGGAPQPAITAGQAAPAIYGGTIISPALEGLDDSGDLVFDSDISGSQSTSEELLRYHASTGALDTVAYYGEQAPGTNGLTFSGASALASGTSGGVIVAVLGSEFSGVTMASDSTVSFRAMLSNGTFGLYSQLGGGTPALIFVGPQPASLPGLGAGVVFLPTVVQTQILNNDATLFTTFLTGGSADFAVYLGTPGNVQPLMSTADSLPAGARTILEGAVPQAAGKFVAFTAQPAAGRRNLLLADTSSGTITRVVSDNDPALVAAAGVTGNTVLGSSFFLNENGQIAFETFGLNASPEASVGVISFSGTVNQAWSGVAGACATIYLWSPSSGVAKVVTAGDLVPNSSLPFSCVTLNATSPSPLNTSGQVAFLSPPSSLPFLCDLCDTFAQPDGVYLYTPGAGIGEIAAANDTLPGQATPTAFVPDLSVPVNSAGEVAFGAELGTTQGFFVMKPGGTAQSIMSQGGAISNSNATFGFPHFLSGLTDNGGVAFTAATNSTDDGLFYAPPSGVVQTVALDGAPAPGGGAFALTAGGAVLVSSGGTTTPVPVLRNFAAINEESDIAFGTPLTGGTADSGYFRLLQNGPAAGTLAPVVLQGQTVPGGGTFNTIPLLSNLGADFSLGPDGSLAFVDLFTTTSALTNEGLFVARPDGTLLRVVTGGDLLPRGGNLGVLTFAYRTAAGNAGEFAFLAGIVGGSDHEAVFVTAIPAGTAATTTALASSQVSVAFGQTLTLTATVSSVTPETAAASMTGNVSFFDSGVLLGTSAVSGGQAALNLSTLLTGSHSIVAQYSGDANFAASNSPALAQTIAARTTSTALASSLNPAVGGQGVTFTVTVTTSPGGAATGTVTFLDGGSAIGTATLDGNGVATLATASLSVAAHTITASYGGDADSAASVSGALMENVAVAGFEPVGTGMSVPQGQSITIPLTLYGAPGSDLSFTLSCSGLPIGASCMFSPNPVTPAAPPSGTTVQLTFSTTGSAVIPNAVQRRLPPPALLVALSALALVGMLAAWIACLAGRWPGMTQLRLACSVCCATFALALLLAGCGTVGSAPPSNPNATPTGLAWFTVTGTSGATSISTNVQVAVR